MVGARDLGRPWGRRRGPARRGGDHAWHLVLEACAVHGDVVVAGGARPFDGLRPGPAPSGPTVLLTAASAPADDGREREFARRFRHVARDVDRAPGLLAVLVQVSDGTAGSGPVVTFSAWRDADAGTAWAYSGSGAHTSAVARQREHGLVALSGSVRCAVLSSRGALGDRPDPFAGLLEATPQG